jgi:RES domain-containing protein
MTTCYRGVSYREALWKVANPDGARYNSPGEAATQYLSLHPLGPWAELLRWIGLSRAETTTLVARGGFRRRMWALQVDLDDLPRVTFQNANGSYAVDPEALISDDYTDSRAWATLMRAGNRGMICPSAALPGTECVVLFGPRFETDYPRAPVGPDDIQTSVTGEDATALVSLLALVRLRGEPHVGYQAYLSGGSFEYTEPSFG